MSDEDFEALKAAIDDADEWRVRYLLKSICGDIPEARKRAGWSLLVDSRKKREIGMSDIDTDASSLTSDATTEPEVSESEVESEPVASEEDADSDNNSEESSPAVRDDASECSECCLQTRLVPQRGLPRIIGKVVPAAPARSREMQLMLSVAAARVASRAAPRPVSIPAQAPAGLQPYTQTPEPAPEKAPEPEPKPEPEPAQKPLKRKIARYAYCMNCKDEFDVTENKSYACKYHPGRSKPSNLPVGSIGVLRLILDDEPEPTGDEIWVDNDFGVDDTDEWVLGYEECWEFTCCGETLESNPDGCETGWHVEGRPERKAKRVRTWDYQPSI
ncbi:uncharacterized protein DSM5745_05129 [Aspergillus mulundensis]|uniref:C2H2-type domain-containing protein n=1 Tax=Aspergillus mulundensis TaxID=1810919 RepID=A0A3D8S5J9_9EURO|nr:hypothetical protein DSM5745_05129 [Aspergillus mulundensis]RDW81572.1 hypothetical protein DSM5745_05129 [Aspergillus mulundensis]